MASKSQSADVERLLLVQGGGAEGGGGGSGGAGGGAGGGAQWSGPPLHSSPTSSASALHASRSKRRALSTGQPGPHRPECANALKPPARVGHHAALLSSRAHALNRSPR